VTGLPPPSREDSFKADADFFTDDQVICKLTGYTVAPYRVWVRNKETDSSNSQLYLPYHSACHICTINGDVGTCTQVVSYLGHAHLRLVFGQNI